jgi:hypothetical protein
MLLKEIGNVLALGEIEVTIGAISADFHAKELSGGTQITKLEVLRELLNNGVNLGCICASKCDIIHKDRH